MGRRNDEAGSKDPWSLLGSDALRAREVAEAPGRIQRVLDRHPKEGDTSVTPGTKTPDTIPVVVAPTPPPLENQSKEDWVVRYMQAANCDRKTAERIYWGAVNSN